MKIVCCNIELTSPDPTLSSSCEKKRSLTEKIAQVQRTASQKTIDLGKSSVQVQRAKSQASFFIPEKDYPYSDHKKESLDHFTREMVHSISRNTPSVTSKELRTFYRRPPRALKTDQRTCTVAAMSPNSTKNQTVNTNASIRTKEQSLVLLDSASQCPPKAHDTRRQTVHSLDLPVGIEAGIGTPKGHRRRQMSLTWSES
uniref:Uncharacterized protein n=3 Tax=Schistocephalus solidus TaxID=70667 RepID=A0A0X3QB84_SCHSO